jgi:hypothetical protein
MKIIEFIQKFLLTITTIFTIQANGMGMRAPSLNTTLPEANTEACAAHGTPNSLAFLKCMQEMQAEQNFLNTWPMTIPGCNSQGMDSAIFCTDIFKKHIADIRPELVNRVEYLGQFTFQNCGVTIGYRAGYVEFTDGRIEKVETIPKDPKDWNPIGCKY